MLQEFWHNFIHNLFKPLLLKTGRVDLRRYF